MGCEHYFTNLTLQKESNISLRNIFRNFDELDIEEVKQIFKDIISKETWNNTDTILCQCCCTVIYYNNNCLYNYYQDIGETNDTIDYFIKAKEEKERKEEKQKLFTEVCMLCRKYKKLYYTKSGLKVCDKC